MKLNFSLRQLQFVAKKKNEIICLPYVSVGKRFVPVISINLNLSLYIVTLFQLLCFLLPLSHPKKKCNYTLYFVCPSFRHSIFWTQMSLSVLGKVLVMNSHWGLRGSFSFFWVTSSYKLSLVPTVLSTQHSAQFLSAPVSWAQQVCHTFGARKSDICTAAE